MGWYILKLVLLLPLIAGLAWGSLKLAAKAQARFAPAPQGGKAVRIVETTMLSPTLKLAVIEFHGREILVSVSRGGLARLAALILAVPLLVEQFGDLSAQGLEQVGSLLAR